MQRGDVFVLNAPYAGGTHLPDVTVVMPVFIDATKAPTFFVAARGHHADIGGSTPGSMPASSTHIEEEGVLLDNVQLVANGVFLEEDMRRLLSSGKYPARNVEQMRRLGNLPCHPLLERNCIRPICAQHRRLPVPLHRTQLPIDHSENLPGPIRQVRERRSPHTELARHLQHH